MHFESRIRDTSQCTAKIAVHFQGGQCCIIVQGTEKFASDAACARANLNEGSTRSEVYELTYSLCSAPRTGQRKPDFLPVSKEFSQEEKISRA